VRCRHRLSKLLLRHGIRFDDGPAWTRRHRTWLARAEQLMSYIGLVPSESTTGQQPSSACTAPGRGSRPRSKRRTIIAVAAARELAGFCWAICQIQ
jgi:hypothetical protein